MDNKFVGIIKSVKGQIVEIEIQADYLPEIGQILTNQSDSSIRLEVYSYSGNSLFCLSLSDTSKLYRKISVTTTERPLEIPVGSKTLGRAMNLFGEPEDFDQPIQFDQTFPIYS